MLILQAGVQPGMLIFQVGVQPGMLVLQLMLILQLTVRCLKCAGFVRTRGMRGLQFIRHVLEFYLWWQHRHQHGISTASARRQHGIRSSAPPITERPRAPSGVAVFMPAHSKTPYITPSMDFYSGKGVVRGRRVQQVGFALIGDRASVS